MQFGGEAHGDCSMHGGHCDEEKDVVRRGA